MYIAMNRFRIAPGFEEAFIDIWRNRETHLEEMPGFIEFHLVRGPSDGSSTLFASHAVWESQETFEEWTRSEQFRKAHANAGGNREMYLGPPQFEGFEVVL